MRVVVYHGLGANCSERVVWALGYKGIEHAVADWMALSDEEQRALNPRKRVPVLLVDGQPMTESMAILESVEELFPVRPLLPRDPFLRGRVREACEIVNTWLHPVQTMHASRFFLPDASREVHRAHRRRWLEQGLDELLPFLFRDGALAVGTSLTLADFFVMPIFVKALELGVEAETRPSYVEHLRACLADPTVRAACPLSLPPLPELETA